MPPVKYVIIFLVLILAQILVCNNIMLFGVAIPFVFIYFLLLLPLGTNLNLYMLVAFLMGFIVDIFNDTPGLHALSCLILAAVRKPVFYLYLSKDDKYVNIIPGISSVGWENYMKYAITLCTIFCVLVFGIEFMSFASFWRIVLMIISSSVFTFLLILATDSLVNRAYE